jgi:Ala-tRNA(Pro) deacylase
MAATKLKEFLDANGVKYVTIHHSVAYTAQEVAASAHVRGREMAKTVVVRLDGNLAMAVVPAAQKVDVRRLKEVAGATAAEIAAEQDFRASFPECDLGAMPPFGNLYGVPVYVDARLAEDQEIAFNACSHTEVMRLAFKDFERLVRPKIVPLTFAR